MTLTQNNGTNAVDPSQTRRDPTFIFWCADHHQDHQDHADYDDNGDDNEDENYDDNDGDNDVESTLLTVII